MKAPYKLMPDGASSDDTISCLEQWLSEARDGSLIGIAAVVIYKQRMFQTTACGEAHRSPVFARGCVASLDDDLGRRISSG